MSILCACISREALLSDSLLLVNVYSDVVDENDYQVVYSMQHHNVFTYLFISPHQQSESVFKVHKPTVWIEWRTQGQATYVPPQWKIHKYKDSNNHTCTHKT